ncbi:MAG: type II toxin-antitoxin system RelE/ParE family toxin [Deltaproteobacteria bacterium]|nr:type II toxin-antitoxin system RelE/ParE family toxin [Deltaproteobacteria bacterium]
MNLHFHVEIADEVSEILLHLYAERPGWDEIFEQELEGILARCLEQPRIYQRASTRLAVDFRRALFDRFPYTLIYRIRAKSIDVLSIHHNARHPRHWMQRI